MSTQSYYIYSNDRFDPFLHDDIDPNAKGPFYTKIITNDITNVLLPRTSVVKQHLVDLTNTSLQPMSVKLSSLTGYNVKKDFHLVIEFTELENFLSFCKDNNLQVSHH